MLHSIVLREVMWGDAGLAALRCIESAAATISLRGKRRFTDAEVERARLLCQYALDHTSGDAKHLANVQYAGAALVEARCLRADVRYAPLDGVIGRPACG